jgi:hypothetical protein
VAELFCLNFQTATESVLLAIEAVSESWHSLSKHVFVWRVGIIHPTSNCEMRDEKKRFM